MSRPIIMLIYFATKGVLLKFDFFFSDTIGTVCYVRFFFLSSFDFNFRLDALMIRTNILATLEQAKRDNDTFTVSLCYFT